MNQTEHRLVENLLQTGRLTPESIQDCLRKQEDGEGMLDTLVRQGGLDTGELELLLAELKPGPDPGTNAVDEVLGRLERFTVLSELGRGGMGTVHLAYDSKLKRCVALKTVRTADAEDLQRTQREVEIAAGLQHPNIAPIYDSFVLEGWIVIAMQYVDGKPLQEMKAEPREAARRIAQAAHAVHAAHLAGIVHRDLKPQNLLATPEGRVFVLDFGIARPIGGEIELTQTGAILGTPAYMSPEQAEGKPLDARTDIHSLGATLYTLVTGRLPFEGRSPLDVLRKVIQQEPVPPRKLNRSVHADLETMILKAMSKDPANRYATARDFAEDLERYVQGVPILARRSSTILRAAVFLRRRPWVAATFLAIAVGAVLLVQSRVEQRRVMEATGRIEEAARKIEEWDRLLFLPARDLMPHKALLRDALALAGGAFAMSTVTAPEADFQAARAHSRLFEFDRAEESISRAVARRPDGRYRLERARIRLAAMLRREMQTLRLPIPSHRPASDDAAKRREVLSDLTEARRMGLAAETEQASVVALECALRGEFDAARKGLLDRLAGATPWEQAELHRLAAWVLQLKADPPLVADIRGHLDSAIEIRRCDAELYLLRSSVQMDAAMPVDEIKIDDPDSMPKADAKLLDAAGRDADIAILIDPVNVDGLILRGMIHTLQGPGLTLMMSVMPAVVADPGENDRQIQKHLDPAERFFERALKIDPSNAFGRVSLAMARMSRANLSSRPADTEAARVYLDQLVAEAPADHLHEARNLRFLLNLGILGRSEGKDDAAKARLREDLAWIKERSPEEAKDLQIMLDLFR